MSNTNNLKVLPGNDYGSDGRVVAKFPRYEAISLILKLSDAQIVALKAVFNGERIANAATARALRNHNTIETVGGLHTLTDRGMAAALVLADGYTP